MYFIWAIIMFKQILITKLAVKAKANFQKRGSR